ncbi:flagellar biosynthesis regulator FlaF [Escherichia coli]|nr:flagellar biosynthesis regulator FlaF [Escherichia coli]
MAQAAYGAARQTAIKTPRSIEYETFAQVTARLRSAAAGNGGFPALVSALHENSRLWILLATDVSGGDNALPAALRARIFYLARFTREHTRKVLTGKDSADVLIEINTVIMRGLSGQEEAA